MRAAAYRSLAVGFFDGVHLGHREILRAADAALTFRTHPRQLIDSARAPRLLMTADRRLAAIRDCGVREVIALDFTSELAALSPEAFANHYLLNADGSHPEILCGDDWRFGQGGKGTADTLRALGYAVRSVPSVLYAGERISSSRIRTALENGAVGDANAMLGAPYRISGGIVGGKGVGRELGYPTINIAPRGLEIALPFGVYIVEVAGVRAIANFGCAPTFGAEAWEKPVLEVHFPDGRMPTLGGEVEASIFDFIRPERRFASPSELSSQIAADIKVFKGKEVL